VKNQVQFNIGLLVTLAFLFYVFPFAFVDAAKFQSGVTIGAPSTNETGTAVGTCGLQIISGVPINYGQVNLGQLSNEQKVTYKNEGTASAQIMVKGGQWITGTSTTVGIPEITRVATTPGKEFGNKMPLHTSATVLAQLGAGQTGESYWSMYAETGMTGSPHQEVTLDLTC